jgi:hypothetical protein
MLLFNGMTYLQKIVNISEVAPALTWMTHDHSGVCFAFVLLKLTFLARNWNSTHENDFNVRKKLPRDSASDNRVFLFQSCYGFGCPGAVT